MIIVPLEAAIIQFYLDAVQQFLLDSLVCFFLTQYYTQFYNSEQNVVLIRDSMNIFKSRYVKEPFKQAEHMQSETNLYCPKTDSRCLP